MKKYMLIIALFLTVGMTAYGQLFINEIDYDQPGTDYNEFIELAGPAYRVTVPTVMETIYLRRKCNRPFYKAKRMFLRFLDQFLQFLQLIRFNKA